MHVAPFLAEPEVYGALPGDPRRLGTCTMNRPCQLYRSSTLTDHNYGKSQASLGRTRKENQFVSTCTEPMTRP